MADRLTVGERIINAGLIAVARLFLHIDARGFDSLPARGPAILVSNHTTNIEGPLYYLLLRPRPATAMAKRELWGNPLSRFVMQLWRLIPINRGQADSKALRRALRALDRGWFLGIAAEGTRSPDGILRSGKPGVALLALMRRVPIVPIAHWGLVGCGRRLGHLHRCTVRIRVGRPFSLKPDLVHGSVSPRQLREITAEIMQQLAALLPEALRGEHSVPTTVRYLEF